MTDAETTRELALRLLSPTEFTDPNWSPTQLLVEQMPPDLANDLPIPPNARMLGSLIRGRSHIDVELNVDLPAADVRSFYTERLSAAGWRVVEPQWRMQGGFSHGSTLAQHTLFCRGKRGPAIILAATERSGQPTAVRITVEQDGRHSLCAQEEQPHNPWQMIPELRPPANAYQVPSGGSGGNDSVISMATLTTELDLGVVAAHYEAQLEGAGWTKSAGDQQGAVAWSRWTFADKDGEAWRGMFVLIDTGDAPRRYSVQVHAQMADGAESVAGRVGWTSAVGLTRR